MEAAMGNHWTLQEAGNNFSALKKAAYEGGPQHVDDQDGQPVVVMSTAEFARMIGNGSPEPGEAGLNKSFVDHLRRFPKLPEDMQDLFDKKEPMILETRDLKFD
jgi:antitoxin Phd